MTTYENVSLPLRIKGQEEATYRSEVEDLLCWVGLGDHIHVLPPVLSGGENKESPLHARLLINLKFCLPMNQQEMSIHP